ncbi:MAG: 4'-phosphopantetheinyl transferase superfamily protein [Desulfobacteraceae bacterium]|nr:4'-phosphopantetheinyl transferase superfamily protein [Desulfobacteraceae bacterium]MBC2754656.1 4'-phosphopantetheinyl transferase superfamily protein [Desulfobacteraceae bacterium]
MNKMHEKKPNIIYPVVLKVPIEKQALTGRDSVRFLRRYARQAVIASAQKTGFDLSILAKDRNGGPIPSNGVYWSLSHKPEYVVGVTASNQIGIDIEPIRPVGPALVNKILDNNEQQLSGTVSDEMFFRCWTAKEAVLKAVGVGLKGLSQCKIHRIIDKRALAVSYRQKHWIIEHAYYDNHVVSVVQKDQTVQWDLPLISQ